MIKIDMMMPIMCSTCRFENDNLSCIVAGHDTLNVRRTGRHPDCPLYFLDDEIRVGDEVTTSYGSRAVVLGIESRTDSLFIVCSDGSCGAHDAKHFTKTGRHFDEVEALLKKMRGKSDD